MNPRMNVLENICSFLSGWLFAAFIFILVVSSHCIMMSFLKFSCELGISLVAAELMNGFSTIFCSLTYLSDTIHFHQELEK